MRILVLSQYWSPENGVPQRRWSWLTGLLVAAGHQVTVVAPVPHYLAHHSWGQCLALNLRALRASTSEQGPSGETIVRSGFLPAGRSLTGRIANQAGVAVGMCATSLRLLACRRTSVDVVIATVPALPTAVLARLVAGVARVPYIIDLRDAWPDLLREGRRWNAGVARPSVRERLFRLGPFQLMAAVVKRNINGALRNAASVMTTSANLSEDLRTREEIVGGRAGAPMFSTVRNVFPSALTTVECTVSTSADGEINVLYAGTLGRAQMLNNALEAVECAAALGTRVHLRLVGTGPTVEALKQTVAERGLSTVAFYERVSPAELADHYAWADTALVHLTDWAPLERAIPSKTFELMFLGIHITGVISGEAADIIESTGAGHVVPPSRPEELAVLWARLSREKILLNVSGEGRRWVEHEREYVVPHELRALLDHIEERHA